MNIIFTILLLLVSSSASARDHDPAVGLAMVVLIGIGVVVWIIGGILFKASTLDSQHSFLRHREDAAIEAETIKAHAVSC